MIAFTDGSQPLGPVYLYKRGTWYPFAPSRSDQRSNGVELQVRSVIQDDVRIENDLARRFPVYGAPRL